jgi:hypothetical protein
MLNEARCDVNASVGQQKHCSKLNDQHQEQSHERIARFALAVEGFDDFRRRLPSGHNPPHHSDSNRIDPVKEVFTIHKLTTLKRL